MIAPDASLRVTPTLSMRTVAVCGQPDQHIKVPLATSTLGLLNRRFIPPGTLADGALVRRVLAAITTAETPQPRTPRAQTTIAPNSAVHCCSPTKAGTPTLATPTSATCCAACRRALKGAGSCPSRRCSRHARPPG